MNFIGPYSDYPYGMPVSRPGRHTDIRKVAPTTGFPITFESIATDLRIDADDNEKTVMRMARAAAEFLEIRTACSVLAGRYEAHFNGWHFGGPWEFNRWPLRELLQISYLKRNTAKDANGDELPPVWTDCALEQFRVEERSRSFLVYPHRTFKAPEIAVPFSGVRVRFICGFDIDPDPLESEGDQVSEGEGIEAKPITDGMRTLLTMLIGHYYENRELFAADKIAQIEAGAGSLLAGYRHFW